MECFLKVYKKEILFVMFLLVFVLLEFLSKNILMSQYIVSVVEWFVVVLPIVLLCINFKRFIKWVKGLVGNPLNIFRLDEYLFPILSIIGILIVVYIRIYDQFSYTSEFQNNILKFGNMIQFFFYIVFAITCFLTSSKKWGIVKRLLIGLVGSYNIPGWCKALLKLFKWCFSHKKETSIGLITYLVLFGVFKFFITIEVEKTQVVRDAIQDSALGLKSAKKVTIVNYYLPSDPTFYIKDKKLVVDKKVLTVLFDENPLVLNSKKKLSDIFKLIPNIKGEWRKTSNQRFEFEPSELWEAGQRYEVKLNEKLLRKNIEFRNNHFEFQTRKFEGHTSNIKFYVNPKETSAKKIVTHVNFNYPVDIKSLEHNFEFIIKNKKDKILNRLSGNVTLNDTKTIAYIHSDSIKLGSKQKYVSFTVKKGIKSTYNIKASAKEFTRNLVVPSMYSYMELDLRSISMSKDKEDMPYHSFHLLSNTELGKKTIQKQLKVYELPQYPNDNIVKYLKKSGFAGKSYCLNKRNGRYVARWDHCIEVIDNKLKSLVETKPFNFIENKYIDTSKFELGIDAIVGEYYAISLNAGFKSAQGYVLKYDLVKVSQAPSFPKEIKLANNGSILTLNGSRKLSVYTRGIKQLKIRLRQLLPNQIQHLLTMSNGSKVHPQFHNYSFDESNITKEIEKKINLNFDLKRGGYTTVDFSSYLDSYDLKGKNHGIFFVKLMDEKESEYHSQLVILSDMAYILKRDQKTNNRHLFVMSSSRGEPISNVKVKVVYKNGITKNVCMTNDNGYCEIDSKSIKGSGFILERGDDLLFSKFNDYENKVNYSRFNISGEYQYGQKVKAYVFSDRKLYRPGESGHLGIIVKDPEWKNQYAGELVNIEIMDSRGKIFKTRDLKVGRNGYMTFDFNLGYSAATGSYSVSIYSYNKYKSRGNLIGSTTLKVQEFLPDKMKVSAKFNKSWDKAWVKPRDLKGIVTVRNLFGTPAVGNKVTANLVLEPSQISLPHFKEFVFYNDNILKYSKSEDLGEVNSNEMGMATFNLDLDKYKDNTFKLTFHSEGFMKSGGRSVVAENKVMVSPHDYLIGIKKPANLHFITEKTKTSVKIIAVNDEYKGVSVSNLELAIYEKKYKNSLVKQADGTYTYQDVKEPTLYKKVKLKVLKEGTKFQIDNSSIGEFIAKIHSDTGDVLNQFEYTVVGEADLARSLYRNAELKIALDKSDYKPGETINISLKAPYIGSGLITIERDQIFAQKWFKLNKETQVLSIKVPEELEGNAYINISLLRSKKSEKVFTSAYSYGVVPFTIDKSKRKEDIELDAPYEVKPGEEVVIKYRSKSPGEVIIYAIDEGILQLANYKTPRPLGYFFKKRALQVDTFQLFSLVLPEIEMVKKSFASGGGFGSANGKNLNPFKRKFVKAVAFWSGIVRADAEWKDFKITIPSHFNGTLKTYAVFVNKNSIGISKRNLISKDDVIITPTVPSFVAPGDEFTLSATIANNIPGKSTDDKFSIAIVTGEGLSIVGNKKQTISIKKLLDKVVRFKLKATNHPGNVEIKLIATYPGGKTKFIENISVRPHTPFIRRTWRKLLSKGKAIINIDTDNYYQQFFDFDLNLSNGYGALIRGSIKSLSKYPYGCSEQLTSKAIPYLYFDATQLNTSGKDRELFLESTFDHLIERQHSNGGISLYPGQEVGTDFLNLYIGKFLIQAKAKEISVPKELYNRSIRYIESMVEEGSDIAAANAIYLLALAERQVGSKAKALTNKNINNDLVNLYLAATYKILNDDKMAMSHYDKVKTDFSNFQMKHNYYYDYYSYSSLLRTYIEITANHFNDRIDKKFDLLIEDMINRLTKNGGNSLWSAQTIMALAGLSKNKSANDIPVTIKFKDGKEDEIVKSQDLKQLKSRAREIEGLEFKLTDNKKYFFSLDVSGFNTTLPVFNKGMQISKRYLDEAGIEVNSIKNGDEVIVELSIQADKELSNAVLVDLLPGGFDLVWKNWVRGEFKDTTTAEFIEKREDRVIIYSKLGTQLQKFYYKIKAVSIGEFITPGFYSENMYKTKDQALSKNGKIKITE